jgi:RNA polymerase sigma-70 factor (ECF subfamily)
MQGGFFKTFNMNNKFESISILTQECINGNRLAQDILFKKYYTPMLHITLGYTKDISLAKDILHESFIKIFIKLPILSSDKVLGAWIKRVVTNTAIDFSRKNKYRMFDLNYEMENIPETEEMYVKEDLIHQAIDKLPPKFKQCFKLYAIEEKSHKEISQMLGISVNTSKTNCHRAKLKLQKELKDKIEDLFY